MDGNRFDALAIFVALPRTRRGLLRAGLGGAVAGLAAAIGLRPAAPVAAAVGQVCSLAGIGPCQQQAAAEYKVLVQDCAQNISETAQVRLACLASALRQYHAAQARCMVQACDASNCEVCSAAGTCQSVCAAGQTCRSGRCVSSVCDVSGTPIPGSGPCDGSVCCSGQCQGFSIDACGQQTSFKGCCDLDGAPCTGRSGVNPACCGGYCAMSPGETTGVCQSAALGTGQACGASIDCATCTCTNGTCQ